MFMKGVFMLFLSLGVGYALCVLAKKQEGILKTLGYTLGIVILVLSLVYGLVASYPACPLFGGTGGFVSRMCPFMK